MTTLYALLPPLSRFTSLPDVQRRLARGDALDAGGREELAVAGCFSWPGTSLSVAALVRQHLAGDAGDAVWLCADPASVEADMASARVLACGNITLTEAESVALSEPLRPLLGDSGMQLQTTSLSRWHVRLAHGSPVPVFSTPGQVLGDDLIHHLPEGDEGRRWRQIFNEVQIVLHQHPLNRQRHEHGRMVVNSLWLWGGGSLPGWVKAQVHQVFADDVLVAALAEQAGVPCHPLGAFNAGQRLTVDTLLDVRQADSPQTCAQRLFDMLDKRHADVVILHFAGGERWRITRGQRWRFWRRVA